MKKVLLTLGAVVASFIGLNAQTVTAEPITANWAALSGGGGMDMAQKQVMNSNGEIFFSEEVFTKPEFSWYTYGLKGDTIQLSGLSEKPNGNPDFVLNKLGKDGKKLYTLYSDRGYFDKNSPIAPTADGGFVMVLKARLLDEGVDLVEGEKNTLMFRLHHSEDPDYVYTIDASDLPDPQEDMGWIYRAYVLKFDAEGKVEWRRDIKSDFTKVEDSEGNLKYCSNMMDMEDVKQGKDGAIYVLGRFARPITIEGAPKEFIPTVVSPTWDYDFVQNAESDLFLTKFDVDGNYQWTLTHTAEENIKNEGIQRLAVDDEAVYAMGHISSLGVDAAYVELGGQRYDIEANYANRKLFYFKVNYADNGVGTTDETVKVAYIDGLDTPKAIKPMSVTSEDGKLIMCGSIKKGNVSYKGTELFSNAVNMYSGYTVSVNAADGKVIAGTMVTSEKGIGETEYAHVAENSIFVSGYTGMKGGWIAELDKETLEIKKIYKAFTGGAFSTVQGGTMYGNKFTLFGRGRQNPFVIEGIDPTELDLTDRNWDALVVNFSMPGIPEMSGVENVEKVEENTLAVYGTQGMVVVKASETCQVNVYNISGVLVRSLNLEEGETEIELPQGFYIVNGNKVVVY